MSQHEIQSQVAEAAMQNWDMTLGDLNKISVEYENDGWETVVLHPGEVQVVSKDEDLPGLDVLIPDDEYRELEATLESGVSFDSYEVYKDLLDGVVHLIVVLEDASANTVLMYPAYYGPEDSRLITNGCRENGLRTYLRRLNGEFVELTHTDPELFAPPTK
ncbi:DUF7529 family protein [Halorubrum trueperi]|uniref:Uncharacterized protein n=1 Tax=Halorubrum trueperi TaxID=2004704 RepID=A0ABD5UFA7_9EURY